MEFQFLNFLTKISPRKPWWKVQEIISHVWRRWIKDRPNVIDSVTLAMFSDDSKCYKIKNNDAVFSKLQQDLNDRGYSFERNCVLRRWESETLK